MASPIRIPSDGGRSSCDWVVLPFRCGRRIPAAFLLPQHHSQMRTFDNERQTERTITTRPMYGGGESRTLLLREAIGIGPGPGDLCGMRGPSSLPGDRARGEPRVGCLGWRHLLGWPALPSSSRTWPPPARGRSPTTGSGPGEVAGAGCVGLSLREQTRTSRPLRPKGLADRQLPQPVGRGRVTHLRQGLGLDLTDALAGDVEVSADLVEGRRLSLTKPVAHLDDRALPLV